jgi:hypothetical protein
LFYFDNLRHLSGLNIPTEDVLISNERYIWFWKKNLNLKIIYSQTCVQRPPLGPEKRGRLTEVSDKTDI